MKRLFLNLTVAGFSAVFALGLGEVAARLYLGYQNRVLADKNAHNILTQVPKKELFIPVYPGSFANRPHARLQWWGLDIHTDSLGNRAGLPVLQPAGKILFLGDSMIFGLGLPDSAAIPAMLQTRLNGLRPDHPAQVINAGVIGYDFQQYLHQLRRLVPRVRPDLVLVGLCYNDLLPNEDPFGTVMDERTAAASAGSPPRLAGLSPDLRESLKSTGLYQVLRRTDLPSLLGLRAKPRLAPALEASHNRAPALVEEFLAEARGLGVSLAFVYFPVFEHLGEEPQLVYVHLLAEREQPLLDLSFTPRLRKDSYFLREQHGVLSPDIHFNHEGSVIVAEETALWLVRAGLWPARKDMAVQPGAITTEP